MTVLDGERPGTALQPAPPRPEAAVAPAPAKARVGAPRHDLPVLELYRAVAAVMVLVTHVGYESAAGVNGPWAGWLSRLDFGVALFFLLSGLLLFRPFVEAGLGHRPPVDVGDYLRRRMLRIFPGLLVALGFTALVLPEARQVAARVWLATVFLVQNYFSSTVIQVTGMAQLWSLCVEMSFYLVLPLLAWLAFGRGERTGTRNHLPHVLIGMWAIAVAWQVLSVHSPRTGLWLPKFLDWFAAGMYLSWLLVQGDRAPRVLREAAQAPGACWSLALALFWLVTPTQIGGPYLLQESGLAQSLIKHQSYVLIAFILLLPAVLGTPKARWRSFAGSRTVAWFGTISYGIFLLHATILQVVRKSLGYGFFDGGFWITLVPTLALSIGGAALLWYGVEKPFQRLRSMTVVEAVRTSTMRRRFREGVDLVDYEPLTKAVDSAGPKLAQLGSTVAEAAAARRASGLPWRRREELEPPESIRMLQAGDDADPDADPDTDREGRAAITAAPAATVEPGEVVRVIDLRDHVIHAVPAQPDPVHPPTDRQPIVEPDVVDVEEIIDEPDDEPDDDLVPVVIDLRDNRPVEPVDPVEADDLADTDEPADVDEPVDTDEPVDADVPVDEAEETGEETGEEPAPLVIDLRDLPAPEPDPEPEPEPEPVPAAPSRFAWEPFSAAVSSRTQAEIPRLKEKISRTLQNDLAQAARARAEAAARAKAEAEARRRAEIEAREAEQARIEAAARAQAEARAAAEAKALADLREAAESRAAWFAPGSTPAGGTPVRDWPQENGRAEELPSRRAQRTRNRSWPSDQGSGPSPGTSSSPSASSAGEPGTADGGSSGQRPPGTGSPSRRVPAHRAEKASAWSKLFRSASRSNLDT